LPGRILLGLLIRPFLSVLFGFFANSSFSKLFIKSFIKRNKINMDEYENKKYSSFNKFFSREVKKEYRPINDNLNDLISPCDGKLTVYQITADSIFCIKNSKCDLESLLLDKSLAGEYAGGVCLIFRLTPDDYHRYCFIDNGKIVSFKKIKGVLHTVRPISLQRYYVYKLNSREYAVLQTENFGKVIQMEIGALFVGCIKNHETSGNFKRAGEKGMFEFGGSTIVMLFPKDSVTIDNAILQNTQNNYETIVRMGCKIGEKGK